MTAHQSRSWLRRTALATLVLLGSFGAILGTQLSSALADDDTPILCTDAISCGEEPPPGDVPDGNDGDVDIAEGEGDDDTEAPDSPAPPQEEGDDAPAPPPTDTPSPESPGGGEETASEPSPTNPPPPNEPEEPEHKEPNPAPVPSAEPEPKTPITPPPPTIPPPPPPEPGVSRVALCSEAPLPRVGQPPGRYHPVNVEEVQKYLDSGYKPAIFVEGFGTTCLLSDVGARAQDYVLDSTVLVPDGYTKENGPLCPTPVEKARDTCGDSAIHPFYRRR